MRWGGGSMNVNVPSRERREKREVGLASTSRLLCDDAFCLGGHRMMLMDGGRA
jgi:hypothetical protein